MVGSSTLKYKLYRINEIGCSKSHWVVSDAIVSGVVELSNKGTTTSSMSNGRITHHCHETSTKEKMDKCDIPTHRIALEKVIETFLNTELINSVGLVGHRVVHGGEEFSEAIILNKSNIEVIRKNCILAPLHNPANLMGIETASKLFGKDVPQVAVFDTAFHTTLPASAYMYALPLELYEKHGIRRYGFHGTSHRYVVRKAAQILKKPIEALNIISCHLGNGSSMAAVKGGKCIDTSMGFTPLEGLVMGTRSGDIDPAIFSFLYDNLGLSVKDVDNLLNKESGMKGLCGDSDIRRIQERILHGAKTNKRDVSGELAIETFVHRVRKYLGSYWIQLAPNVDAVVFTAGIGENSSMIRSRVCQHLNFLGLELNEELNRVSSADNGSIQIQASNSTTKVLVIPADEEKSIAEQSLASVMHML
uniref:Probable acetate kinase n=1 Tax=Albugo laibachii Nc14 TaxID=890382 RepID=F0WAA4_9STRA|nr:acetate kinase putative [Albugo laibachii Nc14]|eukprot:CCA18074.1 acetate kinase putative [Albugo laibachii Nc14]